MNKIQNIPEGWNIKEFDKIVILSKEKYKPCKEEHLICLELEHFNKETGALNGYANSSLQSSTKNKFKQGNVLFGKLRPYLRKYTRPKFDGVCSTEIWVFSGKEKICINSYLYLLIQTNKFNSICNVSSGTHMPRADWGYVSTYPFLLPPLSEQKRIAEVLGCWDGGIEELENVISLKEQQKKWLMQRLLTGKTRLHGFNGAWREVRLQDLSKIQKGQQLNKKDMFLDGLYPALNGGIELSGYTDRWNTEANTITISEGGNSCGFVNFMKKRFWLGGHCYALKDIRFDFLFLYQSLKYNENSIMKLRTGSGLPNIKKTSLEKFFINIPSDLEEQSAIASILSEADNEISQLKQKLHLFKQQKKWLMQQLLTRKRRLAC